MPKQPAGPHDTLSPIYAPIYNGNADDPTASSMLHRAMQIKSMCKVLILASDSSMNVDLLNALPEQLEVIHQLADELQLQIERNTEERASAHRE